LADKPLSPIEEALALTLARPRKPTKEWIESEMAKCAADPVYFIVTYCYIYDSLTSSWIKFNLWPGQITALNMNQVAKYLVVLKARQEGLTWLLGTARPLWKMLFRPIAEILLFSQRDDEATKLLDRVRGMYERLPDWMRLHISTDSAHEFRLENGSGAQALPATTGGRSNAATDVVIDEADFVEDLRTLVSFAKPTIDAGDNKMCLLSTVNDMTPGSYYQQLYKAARDGGSEWKALFLPWSAHPDRTEAWYEKQKVEAMLTHGTLDPVYKQYPATDAEALAPRSLNKRFPPQWLLAVYQQRQALPPQADTPAIPGLLIYKYPEPGHHYGMGLDPAGGMSDGDDSVLNVVDADTKEEIAVCAGKVEPTQFANYAADISFYYFNCAILFEMNNHGQATLSQLRQRNAVLRYGLNKSGLRGNMPGWLTLERNKHKLYDDGAKVIQEQMQIASLNNMLVEPLIRNFTTYNQLASIENTAENPLRAPEGQHDDYAMAWVLAQQCVFNTRPGMEIVKHNLWSGESQSDINAPPAPVAVNRPVDRGFDKIREALMRRGIRLSR
jgi:hypothetical protein